MVMILIKQSWVGILEYAFQQASREILMASGYDFDASISESFCIEIAFPQSC